MLLIYFKIALRNIWQQKWLSLIHVFGLGVSITAFILLGAYIRHELAFDRFHNEGDRIYRIISYFGQDEASVLPRSWPVYASLLNENFAEVELSLRIKPEHYGIRIGGELFDQQRFFMTDASFAEMFKVEVISGDLTHTLNDPTSVAITRELAMKLFGNVQAIDKIIELEQFYIDTLQRRLGSYFAPFRIGAVLENPPRQSHLQFSGLQGYAFYDRIYAESFSNDVFVYFKTRSLLSAENQELMTASMVNHFTGLLGENYRGLINYSFQPLHEIHFGPAYGYDMGARGNKNMIYVFSAIAVFILLISIINFVNLVTARSEKRAVEAAIRKVSGAGRRHIMHQFMGEAVLICFFALFLALMLAEFLMPPFASLLNRQFSLLSVMDLPMLIALLLFAPLTGMLAGAYPSVVFSRYQPVEILRGKVRGGHKTPLLRIMLVIIQFTISVILIVSVMVFNRQIKYMKQADLGFSAGRVLVLRNISENMAWNLETFKAELLGNPAIEWVSASHAYPGAGGSGMSLRKPDDLENMSISVQEYRIGRDFQQTFGIRLKQGRWFDFDEQADRSNFIVNEAAVRALGIDEPIGQEVIMWNRRGRIIGVVYDFHSSSLKNKIEPLVMSAYSQNFYHISIKLKQGNESSGIAHIQQTLSGLDNSYAFDVWYLDDYFRSLYRQEENNNRILNFASLLAIIIAMLGILGLSSYIISARGKEVGIRKVLGASTWQIAVVLFIDIVKWVLLANLIASPIAWLLMNRWLEAFPYRIEMSAGYLIVAAMASVLIVLATVSWQTLRAAQRNPVDAIRAE